MIIVSKEVRDLVEKSKEQISELVNNILTNESNYEKVAMSERYKSFMIKYSTIKGYSLDQTYEKFNMIKEFADRIFSRFPKYGQQALEIKDVVDSYITYVKLMDHGPFFTFKENIGPAYVVDNGYGIYKKN